MRIGVPREIKNHEYRVGLTPASVQELVGHGHVVLVESGAGDAIGYDDASYRQAGAQLVACEQVFSDSDLIVCFGFGECVSNPAENGVVH